MRSSTAPLAGSMRRMSLSSPSQVPCHSSPSTQVTPVTKRLDSMVRRMAPVRGIDLVDLAVAVLADPQAAFGPREARVAAGAGGRDRGHDVAGGRIDLVDARLGDLVEVLPSKAVPASQAQSSVRTTSPLAGSMAISLAPVAAQTRRRRGSRRGSVVGAGEGAVLAHDLGGARRGLRRRVWLVLIVVAPCGALRMRRRGANLRERQRSGE